MLTWWLILALISKAVKGSFAAQACEGCAAVWIIRSKGPKDENGTVGSKTDILIRTENTGKNSYNSKKEYNRHPTT